MMSRIKTFCERCKHYISAFAYCARYRYTLVEANVCQAPDVGEAPQYKQFSKWMEEHLHMTHFTYEFDDDGWLLSVGVKGMPDVDPYHPDVNYDTTIPRKLVHPRLHCQDCTRSNMACNKSSHPRVVTIDHVLNPAMFRVYKVFNEATARPVAVIKPALYVDIESVYTIISGYMTNQREYVAPEFVNKEKFTAYWKNLGYQVAEFEHAGKHGKVLVYESRGGEVVVYDPREVPHNDVRSLDLTAQPTNDESLLARIGLYNRCLGCGFTFDTDDFQGPPNPQVCPMCLLPQPSLVFKPKEE